MEIWKDIKNYEGENKMSLKKSIYEHLKTRKKYNSLQLNYDVLREEYDKKTIELKEVRLINQVEQESFKNNVNKLVEENMKLQRELKELKSKIRNKKKEEECEK